MFHKIMMPKNDIYAQQMGSQEGGDEKRRGRILCWIERDRRLRKNNKINLLPTAENKDFAPNITS